MGNANSSTKIAEKLDVRKCLFSCGGEMNLVMLDGKMTWSCRKCGRDVLKMKQDYTKADKEVEYGKKE